MKHFKKAVAMLFVASTLAAMAGCSFSTEINGSETITQPSCLVGSLGKSENFEFGVEGINSFTVTTDYGETMNYLLVNVTYTNLSEKEQDISKRNIQIYLDNEEVFSSEYRDEFKGFFEEGLLFNDKNVHPGRTKRGYIVYRIYKDFSAINVCMDDVTITATHSDVVQLTKPVETTIPRNTNSEQTESVSAE